MGFIFSNMHDSMLGELTSGARPARCPTADATAIDFVLSSMVNSDIQDIGIITKQNYQSLMDHVGAGRAWDLARKRGASSSAPLREQPGQRHLSRPLEALQGAMSYIKHNDAKYVLLCDSDIIANIDMREMINEHIKSGAQISMMFKTTEVSAESARDTTTLAYDEETKDVTDISVRPDVRGTQHVYMNVMLLEKTRLSGWSARARATTSIPSSATPSSRRSASWPSRPTSSAGTPTRSRA